MHNRAEAPDGNPAKPLAGWFTDPLGGLRNLSRAPNLSAKIEDVRRRVTARAMRAVFRGGGANGARLPRSGIHRVLVCRSVHTLGDTLTLTPLLTELADLYPGAEVDVICGCPVADALFRPFPNVRDILRMPRHAAGHPLATARTWHAMRRKRYDLVIDPDPQSQSGRLLALSAHATYSLGYVGPKKSGTLTHGVALPAGLRHKAMLPVYLLRSAIGQDPAARGYPQPRLLLTDAEQECGRRILARLVLTDQKSGASGPHVGIFANATRNKLLPGAWWRAFVTTLQADLPGCQIVEILPAFGKSMLGDRFPCFYSSDVRKLAALIANLDTYISADCGVMHLAWAAGIPTIGFFSVTDPDEWGPYGDHNRAIMVAGREPEWAAELVLEVVGRATRAACIAPPM